VLFVLSVLIVLALLSHDPRDSDFLAGGLGRCALIHNWIGYFGAWLSFCLLSLLGFPAHLFGVLLLLTAARRLFGVRGLRQTQWDYWTSLLLATVGASMFCGIWPDMASSLAIGLNLNQTPGGALGQRLCAPDGGWMRLILNPAGSAIVSAALTIVGLVVIWLYDWHDLLSVYLEKRAAEAHDEDDAKRSARLRRAEQREQKRRERERREEERRRQAEEKRKAEEKQAELPPPAPLEPPEDEKRQAPRTKPKIKYILPTLELLKPAQGLETAADAAEVDLKKQILQETLDSFGIDAQVGEATSGPRVTLFEVHTAPGVKVEKISQISNNIAMELRATSLRILTPIPGKKSVGIEVPNTDPALVCLHSLLSSREWQKTKARIPVVLGRNISGEVVVTDLAKAPHLLIAGATGSGKSVCINVLIMSLLFRFSPDELRMIMIDPKVVEFRIYEGLPHLVVPVISDTKKVPLALRWIINEMEHRYQLLAKVNARNLESFNNRPNRTEEVLDEHGNQLPERLPYIVLIIDELADIMMTARADVETSLARIAQLSRAVGIHSIIATQRPSVNVITGTIKANFPTRIAFQVTSQIDARTILDGKGAESLLGRGDMLFKHPGASGLQRNQGALVEDEELDSIVKFVSEQVEQQFDEGVFRLQAAGPGLDDDGGGGEASAEDEELIQQATEIIVRDRRATTSYIQRCMRIGYNRAASIMETLEQRGVIGPQIGTAPREILILGSQDENGEIPSDDEPGPDQSDDPTL